MVKQPSAFFAGALCVLSIMGNFTHLPEDEAVKKLQELSDEAVKFAEQRAFHRGN